MNGFHIQGMAQDEWDAMLGAEISEPIPCEHTFYSDNNVLSKRLDELEEGFSKKDWFNILFSTIINICLALSLSPEKASQIYLFFNEALKPIIMKLLG